MPLNSEGHRSLRKTGICDAERSQRRQFAEHGPLKLENGYLEMECVLHIGLPKTGSTSLQAALSENREALLRHGVVYPETGLKSRSKPKHEKLHRIFNGLSPDRVGMPMDWVERFKSETACAEICILSCESFSSLAEPGVFTSLIPRERTRVVMYVREPVAHVVSIYGAVGKLEKVMPKIEFRARI